MAYGVGDTHTKADRLLERGVARQDGRDERRIGFFGPFFVILSLVSALVSFLIVSAITPIAPTRDVVATVLGVNAFLIFSLLVIVTIETRNVLRARRAGQAGSRLHTNVVGLFAIVAAVPSILLAVTASITLDRALQPWFFGPIRSVVEGSASFARAFVDLQCASLQRDMIGLSTDVDRFMTIKVQQDGDKLLFNENRPFFVQFILPRVAAQQFSHAVIIDHEGNIIESILENAFDPPSIPSEAEFAAAVTERPGCAQLEIGKPLRAVRKLFNLEDAYLFVTRPVDPLTNEFFNNSEAAVTEYQRIDRVREVRQMDFIVMYGVITVILLLVAIWLGLNFANRLVAPVRRLIYATDEVALGNFYVQVPVRRADGDLAHLGATFNKMTSELRGQHNKLTNAAQLIDSRRRFTEAVLSGVPAGVIGLDESGRITVTNPTANRLLSEHQTPYSGRFLSELLPELAPMIDDAVGGRQRLIQGQVTLMHRGSEQTINARITSEQSAGKTRGFVVTLDDITDLVTAQRTSAWADVARRIAHEIKNPLTPIQLSAERIKRKYGKVIVEDRDIFDQCTDTIVRQVEDIKRMVDEFSSFARMPKPQLGEDDLVECLKQVLFLARIGYPDVTFEDALPAEPIRTKFDRRLISQAVANILKNATEGISALPENAGKGLISLSLTRTEANLAVIDIIDNGKGFPVEQRRRLLEPYMTTREGGTGLGLPIVAKIFEEHGGGIELMDNPQVESGGHGARVKLWFPIQSNSPPSASIVEPDGSDTRISPIKDPVDHHS